MAPAGWNQLFGSVIACIMLSVEITQAANPRSEPPGTVSLPIRYDADNHWGMPIESTGMQIWEFQQIIGNGAVNNSRFEELHGNEGYMFQETLILGGVKVTNMTVGLEVHGSLPTLNLGALADLVGQPTLSTSMAEQNIILTNAYSLALDRKAGSADGNGTITFGVVDTSKFVGDLTALEANGFAYSKRKPTYFGLALTSLKVGSSAGEDELLTPEAPLFISFAPGNDLMILPTNLANITFAEIGDVDSRFYNGNDGNPTVPCEKADPDSYLSFQFHGPSGPVIRVPLADYFVPLNYTLGLPKKGPDYDPRRHGVCDYENHHVGIAQPKFSTESKLVPFASRGASIPLASPGPAVKPPVMYNVSTNTFADFPVAKLDTLRAAPGIQASRLGQPSGDRKNLAVGLGVGLSLGLVAILAGAVCLWVVKLGRSVPFLGRWLRSPSTKDTFELDDRERESEYSDAASSSSASDPATPVSPTELDANPPTKTNTGPEPRSVSMASLPSSISARRTVESGATR
ncbi:hypothetical protein PG994_013322 [Apiospora phragmitis]|uniref:Peptidase A1 domain-containing protein n=1 Tax=Apiospora phragmitis TaxID=2905665 RepID=A0ABR1T8A2_9PEZI